MSRSTLLFVPLLATGCFHVAVNTGLAPGEEFTKPWVMSFVGGLIPAAEIDAASKCPKGVAKVETMMSVGNWVVMGVTGSLVTPWTVKITCASKSAAENDERVPGENPILVPQTVEVAQSADVWAAFDEAATIAVNTGEPVYVAF